MDGNHVRASLDEAVDVALGLLDHEVAVEFQLADAPASLHDLGPESDVRDEVTVHDIQMEDVRTLLDRRDFSGEPAEISREQAWCDLDRVHCVAVTIAVCS